MTFYRRNLPHWHPEDTCMSKLHPANRHVRPKIRQQVSAVLGLLTISCIPLCVL